MAIRIALLDDDPAHVRAAEEQLASLGYEVRSATSLVDFEKVLKAFDAQVILLDVKMPDVSGDVVCKVLKRDYATAGTPVLLYSSLEKAVLERYMKRAGADGYVMKQGGPEGLRSQLEKLISEMLF